MPIEDLGYYRFTCDFEGCRRQEHVFGETKDVSAGVVRRVGWWVVDEKVFCPSHRDRTVEGKVLDRLRRFTGGLEDAQTD